MHIEDIEGQQAEPAADTPVVETPAADSPADDVAAFRKGAESVGEPVAADAPKVEAGATGADKPTEATGATAAEPAPEEKAAADLKAKEEAEIRGMGLKSEKNIARFRELSAEARKVPELTKQLETMKPLAEEAERFNAIIADTKATPQQLGNLLRYVKAINSGDTNAMREGLKSIQQEVAWLAKTLGEEVQGINPVTEHADLNDAIEAGSMTPEGAREIARARALAKQAETRTQADNTERERVTQYNQAVDAGVQALNSLGAQLKASDAQYAAKVAVMQEAGTIDTIKDNVHPSRWADAFKNAFSKVTIKAPPPKPAPGPMPLRPTGGDPVAMRREPKSDLEAFQMGAASVR